MRARLLDRVAFAPGMRVLDPGAGSGEFLEDVRERCPDAVVSGFDVDPRLVELCRARGLDVALRDAIAAPPPAEFDLVIGNPPYFELSANEPRVDRWRSVVSGRPNAYALFFALGLAALRPGGRLAFVVAPSMNNGAYFAGLRRHLLDHAAIESLEILGETDLFDAAQQSVMLIVLKKGARSERHVFRATDGAPLFLERPEQLVALRAGHRSLAELGCTVKTGRCVWNQHVEKLRRGPGGGAVPLVWAHNVGDDGAISWAPEHPKRMQFIAWDAPDVGPAIVVNRVTGSVGRGRLRAALVPAGTRFVAENHVNVIRGPADTPWQEVLDALRSDRVAEVVRLVTGNTQLSATELSRLVPVLPVR